MRGLFFLSALMVASSATADDFSVSSEITNVVVYPSAASITRVVALDIPAGNHRIMINDLPDGLEVTSLRFFGSDGLVINATNFRNDRLPPDNRTIAAREEIETQIEAQEKLIRAEVNAKAALEVEADAARTKLTFLRDLARLNGGDVQLDMLRALSNLVAEESQAALQIIENVRLQTQDIDFRLDDLRDELDDLHLAQEAAGLPPADRIGVILDVEVTENVDDQMVITYLVDNASWFPVYEFYLDQETGQLDIIQKAGISQNTGEDWVDVSVSLSTAESNRGLQFYYPGTPVGRVYEIEENEDGNEGAVAYVAPAAPMIVVAEERSAFASVGRVRSGLFTTYNLSVPVTLDGDGGEAVFTIDEFKTNVDVYARASGASPRNTGILTIDFTNSTGVPFLSGSAIYYLDNVFIGSTDNFSSIGEGESEQLSFGAINGLVVSKNQLSALSGESGFVASRNTKSEAYEITIENFTSKSWRVEYFYGMVRSEQEILEINVTTNPNPNDRSHDKRVGLYRWDIDIEPAETKTISINIDYEWPLDMELQ